MSHTRKFLCIILLISFSVINSKQENNADIEKKLIEQKINEKLSLSESNTRPEAEILLPIRRSGTSDAKMNVPPCGGVPKKLANSLLKKSSSFSFIWETIVPESSGTCRVRISPGLDVEDSFQTLFPTEGDYDSDGYFTCGRSRGFEAKEFKLPKDYECDGCILQWQWKTPLGDVYSCSDVIINGDSNSKCMGECQNGGACFNGKCTCLKGFDGEFCENEINSSSSSILIIIGILGILGAGIGGLYYYNKNKGDKGSDWTTKNEVKEKGKFNEFKEDSSAINKENTNKKDDKQY